MEIDALNRMLEGMRENEDFRRRERSLNIPGIYQNQGGMGNVASFGDSGGFNFLGGGFIPNIANIANIVAQQQQGPVLGPDDFGSYTIPVSDPTYSSGFDYARSIAGGIPMEQVIAPGVSYSPEQPGGYTQAQLNTAVGTTPVETPPPPPAREPDDPRYFGTGIGGVNIPIDRKDIPFRKIFGGFGGVGNQNIHISHTGFDEMFPPSGLNLTGYVFDPITRKMIPNPLGDPDMTGKIIGNNAREPIPPQDFGYGPGVLPPLPPIDIDKVIPPKINDQIFIDDRPIIDERIVDRGYGPGIMPPLPPMDIDKLIPPVDIPPVDIPPVDIPPVDIPFIPFIKPPSIMDRPLIMDTPTIMDRPTGGRFSIEQKRPMGLF